jgi:hypothetical protein
MTTSALHWLRHSLVVVAAAVLLTGCSNEAPLAPNPAAASVPQVAAAAADAGNRYQGANLDACEKLRLPAGYKLAFHVFATGVQIYHWNGASWSFDGPSAVLHADAGGRSTVGIHYSGPTWESASGGKVVGTVLERCTPDPSAIPWLLLQAVPTEGAGVFQRVTRIQRVNTVGGNAPANPGSFTGEEARVPYTTEYFFYRAQ